MGFATSSTITCWAFQSPLTHNPNLRRFKMSLIKDVAYGIEVCYPDFWEDMTLTQRAQAVGRTFIDDELEEIKIRVAKAAEVRKRKIEITQKKKAQRAARWQKMYDIVMKAHCYYGDIVFEYCGGSGDGDGEETFAKMEMGEFDDEMCKREALFTAFYGEDPEWYDKVIKFWNKEMPF
jgi:hypothetical protein